MITLWISFSWNRVDEEFPRYLAKNKLTLIHQGKKVMDVDYPQPGMALKHESGVIMRIMTKYNNPENLSHDYLLASKSIKISQLDLFYHG